jgi:hypothetical protein
MIIVGSLLISGDPSHDRQDLPAPAEQVITVQHEDLPPIDEVTDFEEPIPVDMVSVVPESRSRQKVEPQKLMNQTEPTSNQLNDNAREMSNQARNEQPTVTNAVPSVSAPPEDPVTPFAERDTGGSNLIDQGVDASDTTNSGSPSMKLLFDQSDAMN